MFSAGAEGLRATRWVIEAMKTDTKTRKDTKSKYTEKQSLFCHSSSLCQSDIFISLYVYSVHMHIVFIFVFTFLLIYTITNGK